MRSKFADLSMSVSFGNCVWFFNCVTGIFCGLVFFSKLGHSLLSTIFYRRYSSCISLPDCLPLDHLFETLRETCTYIVVWSSHSHSKFRIQLDLLIKAALPLTVKLEGECSFRLNWWILLYHCILVFYLQFSTLIFIVVNF